MKALFLTSALDTYYRDEMGNRIPQTFTNQNNIIENLKSQIIKYDNFLFVASNENAYDITDLYYNVVKESFMLTLPFKQYHLLDGRTTQNTCELVKNADFIFLCGGHVPTQNEFFDKIKLVNIIMDTDAVIMGGSAGSMNCAELVYCPPEIEGEGLNPNFKRYFSGLGLTKINIFPHFNDIKNELVDGLENEKDFLLPDSYNYPIVAYSDGAYILQTNEKATMFGEAYLFYNGKKTLICNEDKSVDLDFIINLYNSN